MGYGNKARSPTMITVPRTASQLGKMAAQYKQKLVIVQLQLVIQLICIVTVYKKDQRELGEQ